MTTIMVVFLLNGAITIIAVIPFHIEITNAEFKDPVAIIIAVLITEVTEIVITPKEPGKEKRGEPTRGNPPYCYGVGG